MAGNLVKGDSSSVQDLQDARITCSGLKRRRGSGQQASSRAGKKPKQDIDRDYREKKKLEVEKLKAETEELKNGKYKLEGQAFILEKLLKESREENTKLKMELQLQSDSINKLEELIASGEKINALKREHAQESHALKAKHAKEHVVLKTVCTLLEIDLGTAPER